MLLDDIGDLLSSGGVGILAVNLFVGTLPDQPDDCVAVYETGGLPSMHTMTQGNPVAEHPTIQVVCRAARYDAARIKSLEVDAILNGLRDREINGIHYHWISAQQSPFFITRDANDREEIGCNYNIIREAATSS